MGHRSRTRSINDANAMVACAKLALHAFGNGAARGPRIEPDVE